MFFYCIFVNASKHMCKTAWIWLLVFKKKNGMAMKGREQYELYLGSRYLRRWENKRHDAQCRVHVVNTW